MSKRCNYSTVACVYSDQNSDQKALSNSLSDIVEENKHENKEEIKQNLVNIIPDPIIFLTDMIKEIKDIIDKTNNISTFNHEIVTLKTELNLTKLIHSIELFKKDYVISMISHRN